MIIRCNKYLKLVALAVFVTLGIVHASANNSNYTGHIGFYGNADAKWSLQKAINKDNEIFYPNLRHTDFSVLQLRSCNKKSNYTGNEILVQNLIKQSNSAKKSYYIIMQFIDCLYNVENPIFDEDGKQTNLNTKLPIDLTVPYKIGETLAKNARYNTSSPEYVTVRDRFISNLLNNLNLTNSDLLRAVSIGEEIYPSTGNRDDMSVDIYNKVKGNSATSSINFYRWYSDTLTGNPNLGQGSRYGNHDRGSGRLSDGWFVETYRAYTDKAGVNTFDIQMETYSNDEAGDNLVTVIWASPNWQIYEESSQKSISPRPLLINNDWWESVGWKIFYDQVATSIKYNSDIVFFSRLLINETSAGRVINFTDAKSPKCAMAFYNGLLYTTIPYIKKDGQNLVTLDDTGETVIKPRPENKPLWLPDFTCAAVDITVAPD